MLLGEQLRRRHDGRLAAGRGRDQRRHRGHHGLAGAHVALQQPVHRRARRRDRRRSRRARFAARPSAQTAAPRETPRAARPASGSGRARSVRALARQAPQAQALRDELFERDATRARVHAGEQQRRRRIARRRVEIAQGLGERRPRLTLQRPRRERGREIVVERLARRARRARARRAGAPSADAALPSSDTPASGDRSARGHRGARRDARDGPSRARPAQTAPRRNNARAGHARAPAAASD